MSTPPSNPWITTLPDGESSNFYSKWLLRLKPNREKIKGLDPAEDFTFSGIILTTSGYNLSRYFAQRTSDPTLQWEWRRLTVDDDLFDDPKVVEEPSEELTKLRLRVIALESHIKATVTLLASATTELQKAQTL